MAVGNPEPVDRREAASGRSDTLALLYQGIFTGIVRLQSGRQKIADPTTFRRRIRAALEDVQKEAAAAGYSARAIRDAEAAVVAFLDEAVLSLHDPARDAWAKQTLSVDLYGEANSGEVFFDRLEELRGQTDSTHLGDVLEIYLLCLLLGFEGRYSGPMRSQGVAIADRLQSRLEQMRGSTYWLSPPMQFAAFSADAPLIQTKRNIWPWWLAGAAVLPILLFILFKLNLSMLVDEFTLLLPGVK